MQQQEQNKNPIYSSIHGSYWMAFAGLLGFATVFLSGRGFTATEIGITLSLANIAAAFLQPYVAAFCDRQDKISVNRIILGFGLAVILVGAILLRVQSKAAVQILYGIMAAMMLVINPLVTSIGMTLNNQGFRIDFGFARGIGSLTFALVTAIAGGLIENFGVDSIILLTQIAMVVFLGFIFRLERSGLGQTSSLTAFRPEALGIREFFSVYKGFASLLLGIGFMFVFHNITNTYLLQMVLHVGGTTADMGVSLGLAAMVEIPGMMAFSWILKRQNTEKIIRLTTVFWVIKAVLFFLATSVTGLNIAQSLQAVSFALYLPAAVYFTNQVIRGGDKVKGQTFLATAGTAGAIAGNVLGGFIADNGGISNMLYAGIVFTILGFIFINHGLNVIKGWAVSNRRENEL